jgi:predicted O-methyltransferase YrrM
MHYDLTHLNQSHQNVWGPIQDDEALFLYSIIRGMRIERILEIGGLSGYSGLNFLQAVKYTDKGIVYTCDINQVPKLAKNHKVIIKNALNITLDDLDNLPIELIFFDCHDMVQMYIFHHLVKNGLITDKTVLALHDTNLHYSPYNRWGPFIEKENGYAHQTVERNMVNIFKDLGYDIFSISTDQTKHSNEFPIRHGISVCQKFKYLEYK